MDALSWSASVLMVNPSSEVVVLPSFSCVGYLVPVSAVSVARAESRRRRRVGLARPPGGHCNRIPPLLGGGRSAVA